MGYANPVPGFILPKGSKEPRRRGQFIVTRTFAEHKRLTPQGLGVDIGNGLVGAPVMAQAPGVVTFAGPLPIRRPPQLGDGSLTVSLDYGNGRTGSYTHLATIKPGIRRGSRLATGAQFGTVGHSGYGIVDPHLHFDNRVHGVHVDPMAQLEQNQLPDTGTGDEVTRTATVNPYPDGPHHSTIPASTKTDWYDLDGLVESRPAGAASNFQTDALVVIEQVPKAVPNGTFRRASNGYYGPPKGHQGKGLYVVHNQIAVGEPVNPQDTYTQAQLDAAVDQAEAEASKRAATDVAAKAVETAKKYA